MLLRKFKIPSNLKCYDVIEKIGEGGYSFVFKVQQTVSKEYFAAKIMSKKEIVFEERYFPYEDFHCILKPGFIPIMSNRQFKNIIQNCFKFIPIQRPNINDLLNDEYFSIIENENMNQNKVENVSTIINKNNIETDSQDAIS